MYDGVINIYKEKGYTSHDVVAKMRGILKQKKIGHTGTLDPDAQGVLPVCLGQGTKLCDMLTDKNKTYCAVLLLGRETDTQDTSGITLDEREVICSEEEIRNAVMSFTGPYDQIPPMYSALKVNGRKLCDLAREGQIIERKARPVTIHSIVIEKVEIPRVTMTVSCSKGTYIRTLCHDIGRTLGCCGCMEELLRTETGGFRLEDSKKLSEIEALRDEGRLDEFIVPVDLVLEAYPSLVMKGEDGDKLVHNGNPFYGDMAELKMIPSQQDQDHQEQGADIKNTPVRVYDSKRTFIGIYQYREEKRWFQPQKIFAGGK
ncbi:tRNA pseudouridine(55) synthase TruB [Clostridium sp. AM58-1XD]|uniref:tRNA pseudouridine(55) synthase TruB n=1 Tax=Clostridium sp. AM58-1XD TaxID=2292307 RepID=UPI000E4ECF50|nr:tRNA pseudouridine(55) synthase TruB [Clostridium sp. AM58-1XD]RGZ00981.1 tRNA pseudouridine(55) synthase TruB [Clostridium sp. AM58-1XD]